MVIVLIFFERRKQSLARFSVQTFSEQNLFLESKRCFFHSVSSCSGSYLSAACETVFLEQK